MTGKRRIRLTVLAILALLGSARAHGQLQVGNDTTLGLTSSASLGYTKQWGVQDSDGLTYGFDGILTGEYHDPRFLNFMVHPYLNQSNLNSTFNSSTFATGVNAQANFLSTSETPFQINYLRDYNREGTFNVPGSVTNYQTHGNDQLISLTAAYLKEDWPTLQGFFSHSGTDYEVVGIPGTGTSHSNQFGLNSSYQLWDTNLSAGYTRSYVNSESPVFSNQDQLLNQNTEVDTLHLGANRSFFHIATLNTNFSRSHVHGDYASEAVDSTFDTLSSVLGLTVNSKSSASFYVNYSSDLSAQYFTNIINSNGAKGGPATSPATSTATTALPGASYTTSYLDYGANGTYQLNNHLFFTGGIDHRVQGQYNGLPDFTSTIMHAGATWTHRLLGGTASLYGGVSYSFYPVYTFENNSTSTALVVTGSKNSSLLGTNTSASYSRSFGKWTAGGSGSYSHSLTTLLVGYTQESYTANGNISRSLKGWNFAAQGSYAKSNVDSVTIADSRATSYGVSASRRNFGMNASYSTARGSALQVGSSLVPVTPGSPNSLPQYLVQFSGKSYGGGLNYRPKRRWNLSSSYAYANYSTINSLVGSLPAVSKSEQFFARTDYTFRQIQVYAGYNYVSQGFNLTNSVLPTTYHTFYFGVSRQFNIF